MATCKFCDGKFKNPQAVRAHLKSCSEYVGTGKSSDRGFSAREPKAGIPRGSDFSPALHVRDEVETERARLKLRQIQAAHRTLDEDEASAARAMKEAEGRGRDLELRRLRMEKEAEAGEARREREERIRREKIQTAKAKAIAGIPSDVPSPLRAKALISIERTLGGLPSICDLPDLEILEIAAGVRDAVLAPYCREREKAERAERERRELEQRQRNEQQLQRTEELGRTLRGLIVKRSIIDDAMLRVDLELLRERDLNDSARWSLREEVRRRLEMELTGDEGPDEIHALVGDLLDEAFA